jgi:hypothetical protein
MQQQRWSYRDAWTRASQSTPRSESLDLGGHSGQLAQLNYLAFVVALCRSGLSCSLARVSPPVRPS